MFVIRYVLGHLNMGRCMFTCEKVVFYGQEPIRGESTTTECRVNY